MLRLSDRCKRRAKGVSGNPKGRNASDGKRDFERAVLRLLHEKGERLAAVLLEKAMTDSAFMGLLLARIWPAPRVQLVTLDANVALMVASDFGALNAKLERAFRLRMVSRGEQSVQPTRRSPIIATRSG